MGGPLAEFPDIHRKSPQPYPSLERGNFAELRRSVLALLFVMFERVIQAANHFRRFEERLRFGLLYFLMSPRR